MVLKNTINSNHSFVGFFIHLLIHSFIIHSLIQQTFLRQFISEPIFCSNCSKMCKMFLLATRTLRSMEASWFHEPNGVPISLRQEWRHSCQFSAWGCLFLSLPWGHMWHHDSALPIEHRRKLCTTCCWVQTLRDVYLSCLLPNPPHLLGLVFLSYSSLLKVSSYTQMHRELTQYCRTSSLESLEVLGLHSKNCVRVGKDGFAVFVRPICQSQDSDPTLVPDKNKATEPWKWWSDDLTTWKQ